MLNNYSPRNAIGFELDVMVNNYIGIHYSVLFSRKYIHSPAGPIGGGFLASRWAGAGSGDGVFFLLLITSVIPEGVSFNYSITRSLSIGLKISPLEFDYIRNENQLFGQDSFMGGSAGLKLDFLTSLKQFKLSPFVDYKLYYHKNETRGFFGGISVGYNLNPQNNDTFEFD